MAEQDKNNSSIDFDKIFEGRKKPCLCLDCSFLDSDEEYNDSKKIAIDYEDDSNHEYTVRRFSTSTKQPTIVYEGLSRWRL